MAYIYLNDGEPESEDYETNYFYYDGSNPKIVTQVHEALENSNSDDPWLRNKLYELCQPWQTYVCDSTVNIRGLRWFKSLIKRVTLDNIS